MALVWAKRRKSAEISRPASGGRSTSQPIVGMAAVLLAGTLLAWPAGAFAQAAVASVRSEGSAANGPVPAGGNAAATTSFVAVAALAEAPAQTATPSRKGETRLAAERDDNEDEDEPANKKPAPAPKGAGLSAQTAQPPKKVETRRPADRDDDEEEGDGVTKKPATAPKRAKSPAPTAQPSRKVETRSPNRHDEDEDENDAVTKKATAAPKEPKSPAHTTQPPRRVETRPAISRDEDEDRGEDDTVGKKPPAALQRAKAPIQTAQPPSKFEADPAADQDGDEDDEGDSKKPALAPEKRKAPAGRAPLPKLDARPSADRDDDEDDDEVETRKPAAPPKEPTSSPVQRPRPSVKVGNKPAAGRDGTKAPAGEPEPDGMKPESQPEEPAPTFSVDSPTIIDETSAPLSETPSGKKPPAPGMVTWQEIEADPTCFSSWPKNDVPWTCNVLFGRYPDGGPQLEENVRDILVALYDRYPNGHFASGPRDLGGSGGFLAMLSSLRQLNRKQKLAIIAGVEEGLSLAEKKYPESREMGADRLALRGLRNLLFVADHPECAPWGPGGPECPRPELPDQYACPADWEARGLQRCCAADVRAPEGVESMDPVLQSVVKKMHGACKCFPQGTYGRYTNPCAAATSEDPGLMTAEQWQRKRMRSLNSSMSGLVSQLGGRDDPTRIAMTNALRNYSMVGKSGGYALGTAVAGFAGVGKCSRHFYNESTDRWWGVGLWNSGFCHIEGGAEDTNICMIPPGKSAELSYSNNGNVDAWVMIVSDRGFANKYRLKEAGCKLEPGGNTGDVVLNDPADGDIKTCGPTTYPCER
jgi:hypothetical protein